MTNAIQNTKKVVAVRFYMKAATKIKAEKKTISSNNNNISVIQLAYGSGILSYFD